MTWSYSGDPSSSTKDTVRYLLADTNAADQLLSDEEIQYELEKYGDQPYIAASKLALSIAAKFGRIAEKSVEGLKKTYVSQKDFYWQLADRLSVEASEQAGFLVYAGGISESDKQTLKIDPDAVQPSFVTDDFTNKEN